MSHKRRGLKAFGLSLLAVAGLMAFMAAGAHANWLVEGVELAANENVAVETVVEGKLAVPAKNVEFRCKVVEAEGLKLLAKSEKAEGKVKFKTCLAFELKTGVAVKNCNPKEPIVAGGFALLVLHNAQNYVLFEPEANKPFTVVEVGELCALTETSEVKGKLVAECLNEALAHVDCNVNELVHRLKPAPAALFEADKLLFGANPATLEGVAAVKLNGVNLNKKWAGHV